MVRMADTSLERGRPMATLRTRALPLVAFGLTALAYRVTQSKKIKGAVTSARSTPEIVVERGSPVVALLTRALPIAALGLAVLAYMVSAPSKESQDRDTMAIAPPTVEITTTPVSHLATALSAGAQFDTPSESHLVPSTTPWPSVTATPGPPVVADYPSEPATVTPRATSQPTPAATVRPMDDPRPAISPSINQPALVQASPPTAATPTSQAIYIVKPGDTLTAIAQRHGTYVDVIAQANQLTNRDRLQVGQSLHLP